MSEILPDGHQNNQRNVHKQGKTQGVGPNRSRGPAFETFLTNKKTQKEKNQKKKKKQKHKHSAKTTATGELERGKGVKECSMVTRFMERWEAGKSRRGAETRGEGKN